MKSKTLSLILAHDLPPDAEYARMRVVRAYCRGDLHVAGVHLRLVIGICVLLCAEEDVIHGLEKAHARIAQKVTMAAQQGGH